jgi:hypothetical protein
VIPEGTSAARGRLPASAVDLYVAAGIAQDAAQRERLQALGIDIEMARDLQRRVDEGVFGRGAAATLEAATALFGAPAVRRVERVAWELAILPKHHFECRIEDGVLQAGELVRRDAVALVPGAPPPSLTAARAIFRPWYHTRRDLGRVLGDPERDDRGHAHESAVWVLPDGGETQFDFAHGLLLRVGAATLARVSPPRGVPSSESRPWWAFWRR